jgi:hypothetical protein
MGEELAKPVDPDKAAIDYLPTQYLSELVNAEGYDGLVYRSALGLGENVVLFDRSAVRFGSRQLCRIEGVSYSHAVEWPPRDQRPGHTGAETEGE